MGLLRGMGQNVPVITKRKPWRKILYEDQNYPDYYSGPEFLIELKKNVNVKTYSLSDALWGASVLMQQISSVMIFVILFSAIYNNIISLTTLFWIVILIATLLYGVDILLHVDQLTFCRIFYDSKVLTFYLALAYGVSPIFQTLTATVSTDTIYALATFAFLTNVIVADYGIDVAVVSYALSLNAGIFGAVCLISRLSSSDEVFVVLTLAVELFASWPLLRQKITAYKSSSAPIISVTLGIFAFFGFLNLWNVAAFIYLALHLFVSLVCPYWLTRMQHLKKYTFSLRRIYISMRLKNTSIRCFCNRSGCDSNHTCMAKDGAPCIHYIENVYNESLKRIQTNELYGCLQSPEHGGNYWQCNANSLAHPTPKKVQCCYDEDYCNKVRRASVSSSLNSTSNTPLIMGHSLTWPVVLVAFLSGATAVLTVALIFYLLFMRRKGQKLRSFIASWMSKTTSRSSRSRSYEDAYDNENDADNTSSNQITIYTGESSSMMNPEPLRPRTLANEVDLLPQIGSGRYGEVRLAKWRGDYVAVKIFSSFHEHSFRRECEVFRTELLNHENVLGYKGSDIVDMRDCVKMMVLMDYCEGGSLDHFLIERERVTFEQALSLIRTAASGLDYLHNSIQGNNQLSKPPIAHCDVKSKNILVKGNFVCVIADFGLAVRLINNRLEKPPDENGNQRNDRFGTWRYMPPEILALDFPKNFRSSSFESYKIADMYSFALVMWEVANCCSTKDYTGHSFKYAYEDRVGRDPSYDDIRQLVCDENYRPFIEDLSIDANLNVIARLMRECWSKDPNARLTSRHVKYRLTEISPLTINHSKNVFV